MYSRSYSIPLLLPRALQKIPTKFCGRCLGGHLNVYVENVQQVQPLCLCLQANGKGYVWMKKRMTYSPCKLVTTKYTRQQARNELASCITKPNLPPIATRISCNNLVTANTSQHSCLTNKKCLVNIVCVASALLSISNNFRYHRLTGAALATFRPKIGAGEEASSAVLNDLWRATSFRRNIGSPSSGVMNDVMQGVLTREPRGSQSVLFG